jgi:YHS domain-containing protein
MKKKNVMTILVLTSLCLALLLVSASCKKKSPAVSADKTGATMAAAAAGTEQTICPVLNAPIDKNIYVEYKGKKVYFCCADCKAAFEKEPEKYISKLPQFAK